MTWSGQWRRDVQAVRAMTSTNDIQTETGARAGIIKLGLDVHAGSIVVVRQLDTQVAQPAQRFRPERFPAFMLRQLARAEAVHSCYEAGPFGYVLHRQLPAIGVHNLVVRPRDWSNYGERMKMDSCDANALCSCLDRYLAGNRGALAVVRVPSEAEEGRTSDHPAASVPRQRTGPFDSPRQERRVVARLLAAEGLVGVKGSLGFGYSR